MKMKISANSNVTNIQLVLDAIKRYNTLFGESISISKDSTYYMYGAPDISDELQIGSVYDLAVIYDACVDDIDLTDDNTFGEILDYATDEAAMFTVTPELAFQIQYDTLKDKYNF